MRNSKILTTRRYKEMVLKTFHRYYLDNGEHLSLDVRGLDEVFKTHESKCLAPTLDILKEEGLIEFDISESEIDRLKLTRKGIGYFAKR